MYRLSVFVYMYVCMLLWDGRVCFTVLRLVRPKQHAGIVLSIYVSLVYAHSQKWPYCDQNLNLYSLLWDPDKITAVFSTMFFNEREFKGIKCVDLKELYSAGLKLIGLISYLLRSYGYHSCWSTHQNFK